MPPEVALGVGEPSPIGREAEAGRLTSDIRAVRDGGHRGVVLLGTPGIGKSTLLKWAHDAASAQGFITAMVRAPATAGLPPSFPSGELMQRLIATAERTGPLSDRARRGTEPLRDEGSRAIDLPRLAEGLEVLAAEAPIGIFLDDYQWAPSEGTELLVAALRSVQVPLWFVAATRLRGHQETTVALPEPTADLWIDYLEVKSLDRRAVGDIAASVLGGPVLDLLRDSLFAHTLGSPLFVIETLRSWQEGGELTRVGGYWSVREGVPVPDSLHEAIAVRFRPLGDEETAVVRTLAVLGREAEFNELSAVSGIESTHLVDVMTRLSEEDIVVAEAGSSPTYRLFHPLYESVLIERMGTTRQAAMHSRIFQALRRRRDDGAAIPAAELAHHGIDALEQPEDLDEFLEAAASEALVAGSHEQAAEWFRSLAGKVRNDPTRLKKALAGEAEATSTFDAARAVALYSQALALEDSDTGRAALLLGRAKAHRIGGTFDRALADLEEALELAAPDDAHEIRYRAAIIHGIQGRIDVAEQQLLALAADSEGQAQHARVLGQLSQVSLIRGDPVRAAQLIELALRANPEVDSRNNLRINLAWSYTLIGEWSRARSILERDLQDIALAYNARWSMFVQSNAALLWALMGRIGDAYDAASRAATMARRSANPADRLSAMEALGFAYLEDGSPAQAIEALQEIVEIDSPELEPRDWTLTYCLLAEACCATGDVDRAAAMWDRAVAHVDETTYWAVSVDRVKAQILHAAGDLGAAMERLSAWLERPTPVRFEQGRVLEVAAEVLWDMRERAAAIALGNEAAALYEELGAPMRAHRSRDWLRAHAVKPPGRPRSTEPGGLTVRETEIVELVGKGLTNRQIAQRLTISPATVKKHVENALAKTGATRRSELARFARGVDES